MIHCITDQIALIYSLVLKRVDRFKEIIITEDKIMTHLEAVYFSGPTYMSYQFSFDLLVILLLGSVTFLAICGILFHYIYVWTKVVDLT